MHEQTTPPPLTTPQLADLIAELRQIDPGDWYPGSWRTRYVQGQDGAPDHAEILAADGTTVLATLPDWAHPLAIFLAVARDAAPALLAEAERLRAELDQTIAKFADAASTVADQVQRYGRRQREHNADRDERDQLRERVAELERHPDRATVLREAAEKADAEGNAMYDDIGLKAAEAAWHVAAVLREMADTAEATPCDCNHDGTGEPCNRHEREVEHTDGNHELCGPECEPIALTYRAQDVELGDDDGAHLMLTTDTGAAAILCLSPEQRRALHDDLAPEGETAGLCADCGHPESAHTDPDLDNPDVGGCDSAGARLARCTCAYYIPRQGAETEDGGDAL